MGIRPTFDVLYVYAHQDDELLTGGADLLSHNLSGQVPFVLTMTDGSATGTRTGALTTLLGYTPTKADVAHKRQEELNEAMRRLGVPFGNTLNARIEDQQLTRSEVKEAVRDLLKCNPHARVKGYSPYAEAHDHRNVGKALDEMWLDGEIHDLRFHFSRMDLDIMTPPIGTKKRSDEDTLRWAALAYQYIDADSGRWGIGGTSARTYFKNWSVDPYTIWHIPTSRLGDDSEWRSLEDKERTQGWITENGGYK